MSDTTCTIQLYNYSGQPRSYVLFQTVLVPSGQPSVYANVYQSSGQIESGNCSNVTFTMTDQFFAVLGTTPIPLADGVKVTTGAAEPVTLSSGETPLRYRVLCVSYPRPREKPPIGRKLQYNTSSQMLMVSPVMEPSTTESVYVPFSPIYPTWLINEADIFIGTGAIDPSGRITPFATVPASPKTHFYFQPVVKYYIGWGEYEPGTVVNITELGPVLTVDFTQTPETSVIYTQDSYSNYDQGAPSDLPKSKKLKN